MNIQRISLSFALGLIVSCLLSGCASTPTKVEGDPIAARTFSFVETGNRTNPAYPSKPNSIHQVIQEAITRSLAGKGLTRVPSGGDVTVPYLIIVGNNASTSTIDDFYGFGPDQNALRDKAHKAYTTRDNPNYFEAGTLLVDIVDTRTFKLLRRNFVSRPILRDVTAEVRADRITEAVEAVLTGLQVRQ